MPRTNMATLQAEIAALTALVTTLTSAPVGASAASAHYKARDLPCTWPTPCTKTFRTAKGQKFHGSQAKHPIAK